MDSVQGKDCEVVSPGKLQMKIPICVKKSYLGFSDFFPLPMWIQFTWAGSCFRIRSQLAITLAPGRPLLR
jgi:hypothetical protein